MTAIAPLDIVRRFVERINAHDVHGLAGMMTQDHQFVDSLGESLTGREEMRRAWIGYFYMFPDFTISVEDAIERGEEVFLFGTARGTYAPGIPPAQERSWKMPAAWKAITRNNLVSSWRIYADNEPVRQIIAAAGSPASPGSSSPGS